MKLLSEFWSDDQVKSAKVYLDTAEDRPYVEFFNDGRQIGQQGFPDHSVVYAEEVAENYCRGLLRVGAQ